MTQQASVRPQAVVNTVNNGNAVVVGHDLAIVPQSIVNVVLVGEQGSPAGNWVLIDAGIIGSERSIRSAVVDRFGRNSRPAAIVLTHGHFDHIGALAELARGWDVPIYAHELEHPFLNGSRSYPPPDPGAGGGMMTWLSPFYPRGPINVEQWLRKLPYDHSIPGMPGWEWIATPGHTPGHVSLWRASDRTLISGDAVITTAQESAYAALAQPPEIHGPPMYFTPDWESAYHSVQQLASLEPELLISGHGQPLEGPAMRDALRVLAADFFQIAVPQNRREAMSGM